MSRWFKRGQCTPTQFIFPYFQIMKTKSFTKVSGSRPNGSESGYQKVVKERNALSRQNSKFKNQIKKLIAELQKEQQKAIKTVDSVKAKCLIAEIAHLQAAADDRSKIAKLQKEQQKELEPDGS